MRILVRVRVSEMLFLLTLECCLRVRVIRIIRVIRVAHHNFVDGGNTSVTESLCAHLTIT